MLHTNLTRPLKRRTQHRKLLLVLSGVIGLSLWQTQSPTIQLAFAQTSSNQQFMLDIDNIDTDPKPTTPPQIIIPSSIPVPTIAQSEFTTGPNYTVNIDPSALKMKVSQNRVDFGILSANNPVVRTTDLSFSPPPGGARILTYENQPMTNKEKVILPDSTCDNGLCSEQQATEWSSSFTYGFGYHCESSFTICDHSFSSSNHYKQYPDISRNELPAVLFESTKEAETLTGKLFYKLNIAGTQKPGDYSNTITYIAIPNF